MIKISKPKFGKTLAYFSKLDRYDPKQILHEYGRMGVQALASATPMDTGETAAKWSYKIKGDKTQYKLIWTNSEMAGSAPLVLLLQYGHATKSGYFLSGIDFINPALKPIYAAMAKRLGQEVFR